MSEGDAKSADSSSRGHPAPAADEPKSDDAPPPHSESQQEPSDGDAAKEGNPRKARPPTEPRKSDDDAPRRDARRKKEQDPAAADSRPPTRSDGTGSPALRNDRVKKQLLSDVEMMERRISKLRVEEFRNQATVKALDRQLETVETRKSNYQRAVAERERQRAARQEQLELQREQIASARQRQREGIQEALERSLDFKRDQVDDVRRMRRIHECERDLQVATARERVVQQHDSVRETDSRVKTKAMRQAARKIEGIREQERRELEHDAVEREEKERRLRKLAEEEERLRARVDDMRRTRDEKLERLQTADGSSRRGARPASQRGNKEPADKLPPI